MNPAKADIIFFNHGNNHRETHRVTYWTCQLTDLDTNSGIITCTYRNGNNNVKKLELHISRIKSIEFDQKDNPRRPLPFFQNNLKDPIKSDLIRVRNLEVVANEFINNRNCKIERGSLYGLVDGNIIKYDSQTDTFDIKCLNVENKIIEERNVKSKYLLFWIRD